jgi:hypothetical protein
MSAKNAPEQTISSISTTTKNTAYNENVCFTGIENDQMAEN